MLHARAVHCWLELLSFAAGLGHGNEVGAEEHPGDALDRDQALCERRLGGRFRVAHVQRAACQHRPLRQELESCRIGRRLCLNKHDKLLASRRIGTNAGRYPIARGGAAGEKFKLAGGAGETNLYDIVSRSSSLRLPGTIATGIGNSPAFLISDDTSGPGPSFSGAAASTRTAISSSSSMSDSNSCALSPSRITRWGITPVMLEDRAACRSSTALASSCASARMMSATPSHCWPWSRVSITRSIRTVAPIRSARRLAK